MKRIGLLSDTHGFFDPLLYNFFGECDVIWHAGDIGNLETADKIASFKPLVAVYGNIDDAKVRTVYPLHQRFICEDTTVMITHIGGYPGHYDRIILREFEMSPPNLFITGHSHILKVMNDPEFKFLYINPGSAGKQGFHQFRTAVRFCISGRRIHDLEVWEIPR